jgi:hypothetical protein
MAAKAAARKRYQALHAAGKTDEARSGRLAVLGHLQFRGKYCSASRRCDRVLTLQPHSHPVSSPHTDLERLRLVRAQREEAARKKNGTLTAQEELEKTLEAERAAQMARAEAGANLSRTQRKKRGG